MALEEQQTEILAICESSPSGEATLQLAVDSLGQYATFHPVWTSDEYDRVRSTLSRYSAVVLEDHLGWTDGVKIVADIAAEAPSLPVIMIADASDVDLVAEGFRSGLHAFLRSDQLDRLPESLSRALDPQPDDADEYQVSATERGSTARNHALDLVVPGYVFSFFMHADGRIENEWRSSGLQRISGYSVSEYESIGWERVVHADDHHILKERVDQMRRGESAVCEFRLVSADGQIRWIREFTHPVWDDAENRYTRFVGSAHDITDQRKVERLQAGQMRILEMIAGGSSLGDVLQEIVDNVEQQLTGTACAVRLHDESTGQLLLTSSSALPEELHTISAKDPAAPEARALVSHQVETVEYLQNALGWPPRVAAAQRAGFGSIVAVPIFGAQSNVLGSLSVYRPRAGEPDELESELYTSLSRLAGVAIEKSGGEQALRTSQHQYQALFETNPNVVFSIDSHGRFQRVNPAMERLTGNREADLIGRPLTSILVAGELENVWHCFKRALQGLPQQFETEIFDSRGNRIGLRMTMVPVTVDGSVIGVSGIGEDVTEERALRTQLTFQAFHDSLTQLPNRVLLQDRLMQAITVSERTRHRVAVLFVDLDNFKVINDSLGHESGDAYLKAIAQRLEEAVGERDIVARFGGDEFLIMLNYPEADSEYPVRMAEQIGQLLSQSVLLDRDEVTIGASIGISIQCDRKDTVHTLLREADIALYQAKRAGSGTLYRVFEEAMHGQIVERLEIERDLRRAIRKNEFVVHFQPIISLQTGAILKVEALVRWMHPQHGLLLPGRFLPVAEETGLISAIDALVLTMSCKLVAEWNHQHPEQSPIKLGVNLSTRDFRQPDLPERINATLQETGFASEWLEFEITESTMMQDVADAFDMLQRLRSLGIGFSIDDFGTGYSSLSYLQRLPIDSLKIDRSFIDGIGVNEDGEVMVKTIISLARALNLEVIAEGIETALQLERATALGCDLAQGFHIARPMPFSDVALLFGDDFRRGVAGRGEVSS